MLGLPRRSQAMFRAAPPPCWITAAGRRCMLTAWPMRPDGWRCAAVLGLIRTFFSDYRQLRAKVGLTRYSEQAMTGKLAAAGFNVTRVPANLGHLATRMTFLAQKKPEAMQPAA